MLSPGYHDDSSFLALPFSSPLITNCDKDDKDDACVCVRVCVCACVRARVCVIELGTQTGVRTETWEVLKGVTKGRNKSFKKKHLSVNCVNNRK